MSCVVYMFVFSVYLFRYPQFAFILKANSPTHARAHTSSTQTHAHTHAQTHAHTLAQCGTEM